MSFENGGRERIEKFLEDFIDEAGIKKVDPNGRELEHSWAWTWIRKHP